MATLRRLAARVAALFRHDSAEEELGREVTAHLALIEEEYCRRGLTPGAAQAAARRAMGSAAHAKDLHRDTRAFRWVDDLRRDLRYAVRDLRRRPGFTVLAVAALALGIGVNTTFFTLVNAICLRGLPIDAPDRVLYISTRDARNRPGSVSYAEFEDLRQRAASFSQIAAYTNYVAAVGDGRQPPARVLGAFISASGFEVLGDRPVLGRTFRPDEDRPGAAAVVVLGSELWTSRYASDPRIVGQSITVNGIPSTVIGVMPRGFMFPANADLWRPLAAIRSEILDSRGERRLAIFARLAPAVTAAHAGAELAAIAAGWSREFPATNRDVQLHALPINEQFNPTVWQRAWMAFITAGALVLLVACANVANLLLMRGAVRARELAVRASIGATRARIVRQLLVESAVLAGLAGTAGVFLSWIGLRALASLVPPETLPYWMAFTIDARVLSVTLAVCLGCVLVCGLPSALHVWGLDLRAMLSDSGTTNVARPARRWIAALLTAEFAVTLVLVALGVTSVRASAESRRREFHIDPASLVTAWVTLPGDSYGTVAARLAFFERLEEVVATSSFAGAVAVASALPYGGGRQVPVAIAGQPSAGPAPTASIVSVSDAYFPVLRLPLTRGRPFTPEEGRPGAGAAIVNERFVETFLRDRDPIGVRIHVGESEAPLAIVGVATSVRQQPVGGQRDPVVYLPFRASAPGTTALIVRAPGDPAAPVSWLRREVARLDPNLPLYRVMPFEEAVRNARWNGRMSDAMVKSIALVSLALALVGLYAVTGYTVERWRRELGVRIALGARGGHVGWLVLRRVLLQLSIGLGVGILVALGFDRTFQDTESQSGVSMTDPLALGFIIVALTAVAVVACLVPIRRATRVDPLAVLRVD